MKHARSKFHKYVRLLKMHTSVKVKASLETKDSKSFWRNIQRLSGKPCQFFPNINSKAGSAAAEEFADDLKSCMVDDPVGEYHNNSHDLELCDSFSINEVRKAISKLKPVSADVNGIKSDFFKVFNERSLLILASFFNECLAHCFLPTQISYS